MKLPTMRQFKDHDAKVIKRFPLAEGYAPFIPMGPSFTFEIDGEPMACVGYENMTEGAIAWMILSPDCVQHPRVLWAIRTILNEAITMKGRMFTMVRTDWPEAQRFAQWLGFEDMGKTYTLNNVEYGVHMRVG